MIIMLVYGFFPQNRDY